MAAPAAPTPEATAVFIFLVSSPVAPIGIDRAQFEEATANFLFPVVLLISSDTSPELIFTEYV